MKRFTLLLILSFALGCTQQNGSAGSGKAPLGAGSPAPSSQNDGTGSGAPTGGEGTGHSGGGNGVNNKMLEDYKTHPSELAAYVEVVQPMIKELQNLSPAFAAEFENVFKKKIWMVSPIALGTISSKDLGVAIKTEQYALQGLHEVWVDKEKYDAMEDKNKQATLLVHEALMGIKISRDVEYRKFLEPKYADTYESIRRKFDGNNIFKIKPTDYEQIRTITIRLLEGQHKTHLDQLLADLEKMGFGTYLSTVKAQELKAAYDKKFTAKELLEFLTTENQTNTLPDSCQYEINIAAETLTLVLPSGAKREHNQFAKTSTTTIDNKGNITIKITQEEAPVSGKTRNTLKINILNEQVTQIESSQEVYSLNLGKASLEWKENPKSKVRCLQKPQ